MTPLTDRLGLPAGRAPRVLVVSAHPDDAEIGAGGTIARLVAERPDAEVTWMVLAAPDPVRADEARASAERLLDGVVHRVIVGSLRDGYLPYLGAVAKDALMAAQAVDPDLVLGPRRDDAHQDHRLVAELLPQVFRRATILEYEVPKWDGDLGQANLYVPVSAAEAAAKVAHVAAAFVSQQGHDWFTPVTFQAILRLRGIECRAPEGLAEAFVCRKLVV
jgi:LmbE family N-acetylglucosaminyl deacetylase